MRKILLSVTALILCASAILSCTPENEEVYQPVLKAVTEGDVHVSHEGGWHEFRYTLENPNVQDTLAVAVSDTSGWISRIDKTEDGRLMFFVAPNVFGSSRTACVEMTYGPASLSFDVVQEGVSGGAGELFVFSDVNTGTSSVSYKVTPADQEMTYLSLTVEKEYMDGFGSEEEFFKDDFEFLSSMAASAGMDLDTFLEKEVVKIGETDFEYRELKTDTEYYMYAYGLTLMGVKTTAIYREEFRTAAPGSSGCVITLTPEVSGNSVTVRAEPSDPDQAYYAGVMEEDDFYKFYGGAWPGAAEAFIYDEVFVRQMSGMTKEQIFNELSYVGEKTLEFLDLNAEENYFVFACAVDGDMNVVGQVTVEDFTTGAVERSDNVIEFRPDVIGVNYAEIAVLPSNQDPFVPMIAEASVYGGMEGELIIDDMIGQYGDNLIYLVKTGEGKLYRDDLKKETEYMAFAFGYEYGVPTTDLFSYNFTTLCEVDPSSMTFEFEVRDVSQRGAVVTVYPEPENARYYWNLVEAFNSAEDVIEIVYADYEYYLGLGYVRDFVDYMSKVTLTGEASSTFRTLDSDTEYKPFAVGVYGETGEFATDIFFGETFRTEVIIPADVYIELSVDEYYDGDEVAGKYPVYSDAAGLAVLPVKVKVSEGTVNYYYHIFEGDCSDTDVLSDERIIDELYPNGVMNEPEYVLYSPWGTVATLLGVAEDADGNFGPVFRQVVCFTKDGASPVDGFNPASVRPSSGNPDMKEAVPVRRLGRTL